MLWIAIEIAFYVISFAVAFGFGFYEGRKFEKEIQTERAQRRVAHLN